MDGTFLVRGAGVAGKRRWLTLATLCMAVLVAQVDTAVVNLATRPIADYFGASVHALQWVVDSYNLVYAVLLLTGGLLADLYGRRRIFMAGAAIFTAGSLPCALAPTVSVLVAGRSLAGLGAALLLPASLAIIRVVWQDQRERRRAVGIWAACNGLALGIGPTLGGLLIGWLGWRSIFALVIPLGLAAVILAPLAVPESSDPHGRQFDAQGQVLGALALGGVAFAAIESHGAPATATAAIAAALAALALFIAVERRKGDRALVPLSLFGVHEFRAAIVATTGMTFGMYGVLFLLPLTWQSTGRLDAPGAGAALVPMALVFVLVSPFSGALAPKLGTRFMTGGGVAIIGCGLLLIGLGAHASSIVPAEIGLVLTGLGMGLATGPLMDAAVAAVAAGRAGTASALINAARMAGATIGVALLGAVFAVAHGGQDGLRISMLLAGMVQLGCAAVAAAMTRRRAAVPAA